MALAFHSTITPGVLAVCLTNHWDVILDEWKGAPSPAHKRALKCQFITGKPSLKTLQRLFFVYWTSPGWVAAPLFQTLDAAMEWKNAGYPELEREGDQAIARSKANEEPVHVLIDVENPEKASMWFYTTASKAGMVITGPKSELEAEELNESAGGIYSKEFFDSWASDNPDEKKASARTLKKTDDGMQP